MTTHEHTEDLVTTIDQWDNPLRWRVPSSSRPKHSHIVELSAYGGNGKCLCEDFTIRYERELREGVSAGNAHRCKHIKKARDGFCNLMIKAMRQDQLDKIGKGRGWSG